MHLRGRTPLTPRQTCCCCLLAAISLQPQPIALPTGNRVSKQQWGRRPPRKRANEWDLGRHHFWETHAARGAGPSVNAVGSLAVGSAVCMAIGMAVRLAVSGLAKCSLHHQRQQQQQQQPAALSVSAGKCQAMRVDAKVAQVTSYAAGLAEQFAAMIAQLTLS